MTGMTLIKKLIQITAMWCIVVCGAAGCSTPRALAYNFTVANNTRYHLDLYRDGDQVGHRMEPGDVINFGSGWRSRVEVLAIGWDDNGKLVGAHTIYLVDKSLNTWAVTHLQAPHTPYP